MNRVHISHPLAFVLLLVWVTTLMVVVSLYGTCRTSVMDTVRLSADAKSSGARPDDVPPHCLIYGKYCLGETLHSR